MHHVRHWLDTDEWVTNRTSPSFKLFLSVSQAHVAATVVQAESKSRLLSLVWIITMSLICLVVFMKWQSIRSDLSPRKRKEKRCLGYNSSLPFIHCFCSLNTELDSKDNDQKLYSLSTAWILETVFPSFSSSFFTSSIFPISCKIWDPKFSMIVCTRPEMTDSAINFFLVLKWNTEKRDRKARGGLK